MYRESTSNFYSLAPIMKKVGLDHTFGKQKVNAREREKLIRQVFDVVAPRYDLMNDAMSFGIHRLWKRKLVKMIAAKPDQVIVDLAGGTGDVAEKINEPDCQVIIADPSLAMMNAGRKRHNVTCVATTGEMLALADNSVDTLSIAFGIRNTTKMTLALEEILRVLKPEGRVLCLEFSRPHWWLKPFYDLYSYFVIPRLGAWIARQPEAYTYLVESIRRFPDQNEMKSVMESVGFSDVKFRNLSFGIACIHTGKKL